MPDYAILWDYNGVIVTDEHIQAKAMANILGRYGVTLDSQTFEIHCLGRSDRAGFDNIKTLYPELQDYQTARLVEEKVAEYQKLVQLESIVYPGIKEKLEELGQDFIHCIVTGSLAVEVLPTLQEAGIVQLFKAIITTDEINRGKPNPEGYLKGVATVAVPKNRIVVIEDTPAGITAAHAAALKCVAVTHTLSPDRLYEADLVVKRVSDITIEKLKHILAE